MKTKQQINREIEDLKKELSSLKGTKTEVYSRIVGYYRSVKNWNKGKREEFDHRKTFTSLALSMEEVDDIIQPSNLKDSTSAREVSAMTAPLFSSSVAYYSYFYRNTCPKCQPVKKYIQSLPLEGNEINVDNESGIEQAIEFNVTASPTVIFFDHAGKELFRAHDIEKLEEHQHILES